MSRELLAEEIPPPPRRSGMHVGLVYPGSYAESAASLGAHFILGAGRAMAGCSVGRILAPGMATAPATLEEGAPPSSLPVLLVTVAWELQLGAVVEILRRSSIPPLADRRNETHPVIVAGGALALSNPDLLTPVADVVIRGDGEEAVSGLFRLLVSGTDRDGLLGFLAGLEGASGEGRATCDPGDLPARSAFVTPHSALAGMHLVEIMRGCPHGCGFCIMSRRGSAGGPRFVPARAVLEAVAPAARRVGLVGPSVLEHPEIVDILEGLASRDMEVGIGSARADRIDDRLASLLSRLGLRTLTVALDGASARVRRAIGKRVNAEDVMRAARLAGRHGIGKLKLYVMLGFDGEDDDDVDELGKTCLALADTTRLTVSVGPVVPKKGTPLAASSLVERSTYESRVRTLRRALSHRARVDAVPWREARDEAVLARLDLEGARGLIEGHDPERQFDLRVALRAAGDR